MWTTNPEICELLDNPDDGYKYVFGTNYKGGDVGLEKE